LIDVLIVFAILFVLGHIACVVICFQKGKPWFGGVGLLIGWFALIGAIRLAKPGSSWYRKYAHDPWKQHQARMRFPDEANMLDVLNAEGRTARHHHDAAMRASASSSRRPAEG
jgi:disulfide bond formation protein DsbB